MALSTGGGGTSVLTPRAPLPSPALLTLAYARLFLSTFSQSPLPAAAVQQVFPFSMCSTRGTTSIAHQLSFGQWLVPLEPSGTGSYPTQREHLDSSHRGHTCNPPLPPPTKSLPRKPHTLPNHICLKTSFLTFPLLILCPIPTGDGKWVSSCVA